jgi:hypothetical protein
MAGDTDVEVELGFITNDYSLASVGVGLSGQGYGWFESGRDRWSMDGVDEADVDR